MSFICNVQKSRAKKSWDLPLEPWIFEPQKDNKKKYNLIIYNNYLNNKLDIAIIDYILLSERYKIAEKNGIGKEYQINYYDDKLLT